MINTTIMFFKLENSHKFSQYISSARSDGMTISIPKDDPQYTGFLEVLSVTTLNPKFALAKVQPLNTAILTTDDINSIIEELMCDPSKCTLSSSRLLSTGDNRVVFKRGEEFYVAEGQIPNGTPLDDLKKLSSVELPYDLALYIAATKKLENALYDGSFVYADDTAYTVQDMKVISVHRSCVTEKETKAIPADDVRSFMCDNFISSRYSKAKTLKHTFHVFGVTVNVTAFSRAGLSVKDYIKGSKETRAVKRNFKELEDFKLYALKKLGMKAVHDVQNMSTQRILNLS